MAKYNYRNYGGVVSFPEQRLTAISNGGFSHDIPYDRKTSTSTDCTFFVDVNGSNVPPDIKFVNFKWSADGSTVNVIDNFSNSTGYAFNFDFTFTFSSSGSYSRDECSMKITFSDGTFFNVPVILASSKTLRFKTNNKLEFEELKQITDIDILIAFERPIGSFSVACHEDYFVSATYDKYAEIFDYGSDDAEIGSLDNNGDKQANTVDSLIKSDTTPKYEYQSVDFDLSNSRYVKGIMDDILSNDLIVLVIVPILVFCLIKYILFGKG